MENKKYYLTNKKIKEKVNNQKKIEKINNTESFTYKKVNKKKSNLSFDFDANIKNNNLTSKKEKNNSKQINIFENNQQLYLNNLNNLNDVEIFDEPKNFYNKIFLKTQNSFFNKNNEQKKINKIYNHNENVFDNEQYQQYQIINDNGDVNTVNNSEKNTISNLDKKYRPDYNKIEYNNINQNNLFCV